MIFLLVSIRDVPKSTFIAVLNTVQPTTLDTDYLIFGGRHNKKSRFAKLRCNSMHRTFPMQHKAQSVHHLHAI